MTQVNMFEAKSDLSRLIRLLETKEEDVIYLARNGKRVAQLTLIPENTNKNKIGIASGELILPERFDRDFDELDNYVASLFGEGEE